MKKAFLILFNFLLMLLFIAPVDKVFAGCNINNYSPQTVTLNKPGDDVLTVTPEGLTKGNTYKIRITRSNKATELFSHTFTASGTQGAPYSWNVSTWAAYSPQGLGSPIYMFFTQIGPSFGRCDGCANDGGCPVVINSVFTVPSPTTPAIFITPPNPTTFITPPNPTTPVAPTPDTKCPVFQGSTALPHKDDDVNLNFLSKDATNYFAILVDGGTKLFAINPYAVDSPFSVNIGKYAEGSHVFRVFHVPGAGHTVPPREIPCITGAFTVVPDSIQPIPTIPGQRLFPPIDVIFMSNCQAATNTGDTVLTISCIFPIMKNVINFLLSFAAIIAVFLIVFSGIRYITSRGNPEGVESARKTLTWAIIGLLVIVFSLIIVNLIAYFTGVGLDQLLNLPV